MQSGPPSTASSKPVNTMALPFQGSIYRDRERAVHPFISSMLTLTVALQRDTKATSAGSEIKAPKMSPDQFWEIKFSNATKRWSFMAARVVTRLPAVEWAVSQFLCNQVERCSLNWLINTPGFLPSISLLATPLLLHLPQGCPFCCSCPACIYFHQENAKAEQLICYMQLLMLCSLSFSMFLLRGVDC